MDCEMLPSSGGTLLFTSPAQRCRKKETNSNFTPNSQESFPNCFNEITDETISLCRDGVLFEAIRIICNHYPYNWWPVSPKNFYTFVWYFSLLLQCL